MVFDGIERGYITKIVMIVEIFSFFISVIFVVSFSLLVMFFRGIVIRGEINIKVVAYGILIGCFGNRNNFSNKIIIKLNQKIYKNKRKTNTCNLMYCN